MKLKALLVSLGLILMVGCSDNTEVEEDLEGNTEEVVFNENESTYDSDVAVTTSKYDILELYDSVDKNDLKYEYDEDGPSYLYEYNGGMAYGSDNSENFMPSINDKKYKPVLEEFSFASEENPINKSYDEAIELVKKVLPDDIKKVDERDYIDGDPNYIGIRILEYSSSKGNFLVAFAHGYTDGVYDKDKVAGINYHIEIDG